MDRNFVLVLADLVTHLSISVKALEISGLTEAVQVGGVARDGCRMRYTVKLSYKNNRACARTGRHAAEIKDGVGTLDKSHRHGEEEEDGGEVHGGGICARHV